MTILYLGLGLVNIKNLRDCLTTLKNFSMLGMDNPNDVMLPSLKLKEKMLK
jgi:hypothetical protein